MSKGSDPHLPPCRSRRYRAHTIKSASGTETDTETATPYPAPVAGPFTDSKTTTTKIGAFSMTFEHNHEQPTMFPKQGSPDETHTSKGKTTYAFSDIVITTTASYESSHFFPGPPINPCGCKDAGGGSMLDLTGVASAILSMLGPIFGGSKGQVYPVPEGVPADPTAPPADPTAPADH